MEALDQHIRRRPSTVEEVNNEKRKMVSTGVTLYSSHPQFHIHPYGYWMDAGGIRSIERGTTLLLL